MAKSTGQKNRLLYVRRKGLESWVCVWCQQLKSKEYFSRDGQYRDDTPRYCGFCKDCVSIKAKEAYQRDIKKCKERVSRYRDKNMALCRLRQRCRMVNITVEEYNVLFGNHNGTCDICGVPEIEMHKKLCIDHNHSTGKIRGLICNKCNTALGLLYDNPAIVKKMIEYLEEHD